MRPLASEFVEQKDGVESWKDPERYKAAAVWRVIRPHKEKMDWHKLVWFSLNVPKHSLISWMAILNRLPTKDRMSEWGMQLDRGCVLCHNAEESRNHIFFGCSFSKGICKEVLSLCHLDRGVLD